MPRCPDGAVPVLSGDGSERAMLIGQAPGRREIELGLPFAGDAGRRLVGWLGAAEVSVEDFRRRWYVTSVGKCYPGRGTAGGTDRAPSRSEVARWKPFLDDEVRLVVPRLVVLVGGLAHRYAFGPEARLESLVGRELRWERTPRASVICLPHPSGASAWLYRGDHVDLWRAGIGLLADRWREIEAGD
jgi:uracil-DNA glycosylase